MSEATKIIETKKDMILKLKLKLQEEEKELKLLLISNHKEESKTYSLSDFIGKNYVYDRPQKWSHPRGGLLDLENKNNFDYLNFNGVFSGKELQSIYMEGDFNNPTSFFDEEALYVTFVIQDEDSDFEAFEPIPLVSVYELLAFKL
jgi:hypothetical protein